MANGYNQYIGMRYVPIIDGEWSQSKAYEPLVVVTYNGNSYISKTYAPAGTLPTNETYWILAANYNAQVEQYRQEVRQYQETVTDVSETVTSLKGEVSNNTDYITRLDSEMHNLFRVIQVNGIQASMQDGSTFDLSAPAVTGYTFVCWLGCFFEGWAGIAAPTYMNVANTGWTVVKLANTSAVHTVTPRAYAMYVRTELL